MINKLSFECPEKGCKCKFISKLKLEEHIKQKHPTKQTKEKKATDKMNSLFEQIKNLETFVANESHLLKEHFDIPDMPDYDNLLLDESDFNIDNNKPQTKDELNKDQINTKSIDLNDNNKHTGIDEITDNLIGIGNKYKTYNDIKELDLSNSYIITFISNKNIPFDVFNNVTYLDLSNNEISYSYDIRLFPLLKTCILSNNKINDIGFTEYLKHLENINIENNLITSITSLNKTSKSLQTLKLANNTISYQNSTLKTIHNLKQLTNLTISNNPFLNEIPNYRHLFIFKYKTLLFLDNKKIEDVDRDVSRQYMLEHKTLMQEVNSAFENRPNTSRTRLYNAILNNNNMNELTKQKEIDDDCELDEIGYQTQMQFRVGNTVITKQGSIPFNKDKIKFNNNNNANALNKVKLPDIKTNMNKKQINELQSENRDLKELIHEQKREIDNLKFELENINQINKEYESIIETYKKKANTNNSKNYNTSKTFSKQNEIAKLTQQLETWKKEYFDLLNKTMNTNEIINNHQYYNKNVNDDVLFLQTSQNNYEDNLLRNSSITTIERPQTAQGRKYQTDDFERVLQGIKIMRQKNLLDDSLDNEEEDNENEITKVSEIKHKEVPIKQNNKKIKDNNNINKKKLNDSGILNNCPVVITKGMFPKTGSEVSLAPIKSAKGVYKTTSNQK
jgi:hypothetical protein